MSEIQALPAPPLNTPSAANVCDLWVIDAETEIVCDPACLLQPTIPGHTNLNLPTFAFYIYNPRVDKRVLFDSGTRKDWWNLPPRVVDAVTSRGVLGLHVKNEVYDILAEHHAQHKDDSIVDPDAIDAVVWSHFHYDHVGNIQRFPKSTSIVVGPGFETQFLPGYPVREDAPLHQADFDGRELVEISFDNGLKIGKYDAHDYFGDGSFYLLNTPGHTLGHISGLVRTTADTFVFLGGDISHFPGMYRPSPYRPLPATIPAETPLDTPRLPLPCPCSLFTACHPRHPDEKAARTEPYYQVSQDASSWYDFPVEASRTVESLQEFDADENVFVAIAHDTALREIVDAFPHGTLNDWKAKRWGSKSHWHFVNELPVEGRPGRPAIVDGFVREP
jgi:glyoxylase-like metal-dependent hydrolase (beta-lactamase superfamily II)